MITARITLEFETETVDGLGDTLATFFRLLAKEGFEITTHPSAAFVADGKDVSARFREILTESGISQVTGPDPRD